MGSTMMVWEQEFWRETMTMGGDGWSCCRTWTLAVLLFIFTCRLLRLRFRFCGPSSSAAAAVPEADAARPLVRTPPVVSDSDLKNLIDSLDGDSSDGIWENVIDRRSNSVSYKAKCCKPKDGPLKYLSVTTFENCSAEVLMKFYMDNQYRVQWDKTVVSHQQLQLDHDCAIEIGRTIKKFLFLTPREYVLAWKVWQGLDGSFYCFSKECEHPLAPKREKCVRVAVFRSGWRIRKVPGRNASEIRVMHQEDAGLKVEVAKIAFAKGIWNYVCKMDDALRKYSTRMEHQPHSSPGGCLSIQKVPTELEATNNQTHALNPEKLTETITHDVGNRKRNKRRLYLKPSNKFITSGLVIIGGAICLSRGHSSLGAKVAMAYMLGKLTKRVSSSAAKIPSKH